MPDQKQHLADMVAALVNNNSNAAQVAFQQYMVIKTHDILTPPQPEDDSTPVVDATQSK
jgi:hypothetical protein